MFRKSIHRIPARLFHAAGQLCFLIFCALVFSSAQKAQIVGQSARTTQATPAAPLLTRSTTRHETRRFSYGGTLTIVGPPMGSIAIEGWERSEVDITADIEWRASTEQDLTRIAALENFVLDEDADHLRILTTGTHDKVFMRRVARGFPKNLIGLPWKIDFRIRVPIATDLEINAGNGPLKLSGVEGAIRVSALESDTTLSLAGGNVSVTILRGTITLSIPARGWRGSGAILRLATGALTIEFPAGFNADINADVLRLGKIENDYPALAPRERSGNTPNALRARAGSGGATLSLTVGDGTIRIRQMSVERQQTK